MNVLQLVKVGSGAVLTGIASSFLDGRVAVFPDAALAAQPAGEVICELLAQGGVHMESARWVVWQR